MKYYVGIDLGGTNIVAGVVDENYNIISKASTKTNCPRPEKEIADDMAKMALQAVKNANLEISDIEWLSHKQLLYSHHKKANSHSHDIFLLNYFYLLFSIRHHLYTKF